MSHGWQVTLTVAAGVAVLALAGWLFVSTASDHYDWTSRYSDEEKRHRGRRRFLIKMGILALLLLGCMAGVADTIDHCRETMPAAKCP